MSIRQQLQCSSQSLLLNRCFSIAASQTMSPAGVLLHNDATDLSSPLHRAADLSTSGSLKEPAFRVALIAGGVAGTSVDMALFPLDTVKTRMQSGDFYRSGGFRGVYNGVFAAAAGSAPGAALFFSTYETVKQKLTKGVEPEYHAWCYMMSSACGEAAACWIRVPTENVKQKIQAGIYPNLHECIRGISRSSKGYRAFYKGYTATVSREIPFSFIQFPIYETLKKRWSAQQGSDVTPIQVSLPNSA